MASRVSYRTDGPIGIDAMYLCALIPSTDVTHYKGETYVSVNEVNEEALCVYFNEEGYDYVACELPFIYLPPGITPEMEQAREDRKTIEQLKLDRDRLVGALRDCCDIADDRDRVEFKGNFSARHESRKPFFRSRALLAELEAKQ